MAEIDQFIGQPGNDTFGAAVEFRRNAFGKRCDLGDAHLIPRHRSRIGLRVAQSCRSGFMRRKFRHCFACAACTRLSAQRPPLRSTVVQASVPSGACSMLVLLTQCKSIEHKWLGNERFRVEAELMPVVTQHARSKKQRSAGAQAGRRRHERVRAMAVPVPSPEMRAAFFMCRPVKLKMAHVIVSTRRHLRLATPGRRLCIQRQPTLVGLARV